ncbi:hypothetical protein [Tropicibacter sp. S64]|uniref:hypothetical protein n=1 Tax=Tropicibacter sp. S64 TaxID=3415122 RepID=UPI003C7AB944
MKRDEKKSDTLKDVTLAAHFFGLENTTYLSELHGMVPLPDSPLIESEGATINSIIASAIERISKSRE